MTVLEAVLAVLSIALLLSVMTAVRWLGNRFDWSAELQRKTVHLATGIFALLLPLLFSRPTPVAILMALAILVMLALRLPALATSGAGASLHSVERKSYGDIFLAIAVAVTFFRSSEEPILYVLPIAVLTLSDAAAALAGVRYGQRIFTVEAGTKSVEGSAVFFVVTWLLSMIAILLMTDVGRINVVILSLLIAVVGTLVEADSWRGYDNLFVPIGLHLFLANYLHESPAELIILAGELGLLIAGFMLIGPRFGLTIHAARAYALLIFVILSVTAAYNAILPLAAIAAHVHARSVRPSESEFPDLSLLSAIALIGLFWLVVGEWQQRNAINLYNLTFAALALGLLSIAGVVGKKDGLLAALILGVAVVAISVFNAADARWYGFLWPWVVLAFAGSWFIPKIWQTAFDRYRSLRLSGLALATPLLLYVASPLMP